MVVRGKYFAILIAFTLLHTAICDTTADVQNTVKELEERSRTLYGDAQRRSIKQWELEADDASVYPNGDKQKLVEMSRRWTNYYRCTSHLVNCITSSGRLPSVHVVVYEGEVARLPCGLCVAPGEEDRVTWSYAQSMHNVTFTPLSEKRTMTFNVNVTIYNTQRHDAGVYRCRLGGSVGGLVLLQVLDDDEYDVNNNNSDPSDTERASDAVFKEFPYGIGFKSGFLPAADVADRTTNKRNIILTESCKIPCQQVLEVRSASGELLERANNSAGAYSLSQRPAPQPPPPERDVIFTEYGDRVTLKCPGTTLRDIPVTWRRGTKHLVAETLAEETGGRVHLTARDQIVFVSVQDDDANVYSCWQSTAVAGVLKLEVWRDARLANGRPVAVACLTVLAVALRYTVRLLHSKLRHAP